MVGMSRRSRIRVCWGGGSGGKVWMVWPVVVVRWWGAGPGKCGGVGGARGRENVGWGVGGDEAQMLDLWRGTSVHRDAILAADVTEVGAARVFVPSSPWGYYWAVDFGRPAAAPGISGEPAARYIKAGTVICFS